MIQMIAKLAIPVVLLSLSACRDPLGPEDFAGTYMLISVAGDPLPALAFESPTYSQYVVSEDLEIRGADGAVIRRVVEQRPNVGPVRRLDEFVDYTVRIEGDHLLLYFVCPGLCTASIVPPLRAYREPGGGLRVEGPSSRGTLRYAKAVVGLRELLASE